MAPSRHLTFSITLRPSEDFALANLKNGRDAKTSTEDMELVELTYEIGKSRNAVCAIWIALKFAMTYRAARRKIAGRQ